MSKLTKYQGLIVSTLLLACSSMAALAAPQTGTPADGGLINEQQVLYWLIKRGEVAADASDVEKQAAVDAFVSRGRHTTFKPAAIEVKAEQLRVKRAAQKNTKSAQYVAANNKVLADQDITKTVKVLAVLVDFPDLPHDANQLKAGDSDMYYSSYPAAHYQQLLFSQNGFAGPSNQTLQSAYQYFQAVSGNSFYFTGEVRDWVTADHDAAYYGGNNSNDDDNAVPELVKEAVTKAVVGMTDAELESYDIEDPFDIDGDGNYDEADGIIDHVMLFHSSIGEEAGGGVLADDAIWSHRFYVDSNTNGYVIPGRGGLKVFGYTVQPIDAAAGVCTHEFGHDLGLPDEYDTTNSGDGSPVGAWSLMSGGSWTGSIAGAQPSGFSPYAKSFLQQKYKGKWVNEQHISLANLTSSGTAVKLNHAVNSDAINQLSIALPAENIAFKAPLTGKYQYYSGQGDMMNNAMSFNVSLPLDTPLALSFQAHWDIEDDYDYVQVLVDSVAIEGNYTSSTNAVHPAVKNFISGKSSNISTAAGVDAWVNMNFDLSAYAGRDVQISVVYKTDEAVGDYGMAIDDIQLINQGSAFYIDGAEADGMATLSGFSRIEDSLPGKARRYIVQLRSHQGVDAGLVYDNYEPGVLLWLENFNQNDNNVSDHSGKSLIGVVDADQNLIGAQRTDVQIRDAAFSLYPQSPYVGDSHLAAESLFDDNRDYSAPLKQQSGMILPELGLTMQITEQASDSSTATLEFALSDSSELPAVSLVAEMKVQASGADVSFNVIVSGGSDYSYAWSFGENNATSSDTAPSYTYSASGDYIVSVLVTDAAGNTVTATDTIRVVIQPLAAFTLNQTDLTVALTNISKQGFGNLTYLWDFGDSSSSTVENPSHTYSTAGTYTITLVTTDSIGNEVTANQVITVSSPIITATTSTTTTDNGSSGGSLGWLTILMLSLFGFLRKRV
ncbi:M6 family metalloprotease domain-containing protein [Shewanella vesiculosa]|uniref:immune inhibitor A domain-containing protein n=1 Tax=Shewanella vesiculosa TaxID=518738 RepID=UPI000F50806D|nr:immune inhibitor A domain-containing protein [Shewanella vesiculosa]RPA42463.1 M6 family metalloprotease domain-containing protein [Shewanella vesiculosa]UJL41933.1 immune inhibitor A [Shewanella vesiculosa]